jgi:toxin CcdB
MAQHQVYRLANGDLVLDLQSDVVRTNSRIVARLVPEAEFGSVRLSVAPVFEIGGDRMVLMAPQMAAIPAFSLSDRVYDLSAHRYDILRAIDLIFTGV